MGGKHRILVNFFVRRSPWNNRFETSVHSLQIPHNRGVDVPCKSELLEPQLTIRAASRMLLTGIPFKSNTIGLIPANLTYGIRTQPQFPAQPIHSSRLIARRFHRPGSSIRIFLAESLDPFLCRWGRPEVPTPPRPLSTVPCRGENSMEGGCRRNSRWKR